MNTLKSLILAIIGITTTMLGEQLLPVPASLQHHAVYYVKTKQLDQFSCGYNVLFNAANFEESLGFANKHHTYPVFRDSILPYLQYEGFNPKAGSTNHIAEAFSQVLGLQPFYHLSYSEKNLYGVGPLISDEIWVTCEEGTPQWRVGQLLDKAYQEKQDKQLSEIRKYLRTNKYAVVHFDCSVQIDGTGHAILLSLHQNESGRGLFMFDNMNSSINNNSEITRFIEYLVYTFDISNKQQFNPPRLPDRWLHLDRRER